MADKLQRRFVVTAMTAISFLLIFLLAALNIANGIMNSRQADRLLSALAEPMPPMPMMPQRDFRFFDEPPSENSKMSAVYFSVSYSPAGQVEHVDLSRIASVSAEDALEIAENATRDKGRISGFMYKRVDTDKGYRLVFLDTDMQRGPVLRLALASLLAGALCWVLMLCLVVLLSKRAIAPMAENIEKQRRFVTDAGHELKTPLAIILANTEAMELHTGETKYSRNIRHQVDRLRGLTENLLCLARADESKFTGDVDSFCLSALVKESAAMFRESAQLKELSLETRVDDGLYISGSRQQLSQLMSILLDNAVKYSPRGGRISVALLGGERPKIEIKNSVSNADTPTDLMFDRFYRADSSRSRKSGGFGIGLSAAKAIVNAHGGSIEAEYENRDMICFRITL